MSRRVPFEILVNIGDESELIIPDFKFDNSNPKRVPVADIVEATGVERSRLPGKKGTAIVTETPEEGVKVSGYELD